MKKFELGKDYLILAVLTLITVLSWTAMMVYQSATRSTVPKVTQEQMAPFDEQIRVETLEKLKNSLSFK